MDDEDGGEEAGAPAWMVTFSDLATLLLTFFILLLSFANMDVENFKVALGSVKEAFGVSALAKGDFEARSTSPIELSDRTSSNSLISLGDSFAGNDKDAAAVQQFVAAKGMGNSIEVSVGHRGVMLRVKDMILFDTGSDELKPGSAPVLDAVVELSELAVGNLTIEGHTDDLPIHSLRFPSNWELSAARASSVLKYLSKSDELTPDKMSIAGYANFRPVAPNDTREGRSQNRRVEFVFDKSSPRKTESGSTGSGGPGDARPAQGLPFQGGPRMFRLPFYGD